MLRRSKSSRWIPPRSVLLRLRDDETASTAVEYSLVATLVSIAIVGGVTALGSRLTDAWSYLAQRFAGG